MAQLASTYLLFSKIYIEDCLQLYEQGVSHQLDGMATLQESLPRRRHINGPLRLCVVLPSIIQNRTP